MLLFFRYVLGVESSIVCDIISSADQDGLMSLTKDDFSKEDAEKEYIKFTLEDAIIPPVHEEDKQNENEYDEDEDEE